MTPSQRNDIFKHDKSLILIANYDNRDDLLVIIY